MKRQILATAAIAALLLAACGDDDETTETTAAGVDTTIATADTTAGADTTMAGATGGDAAACAEGKTLESGTLSVTRSLAGSHSTSIQRSRSERSLRAWCLKVIDGLRSWYGCPNSCAVISAHWSACRFHCLRAAMCPLARWRK